MKSFPATSYRNALKIAWVEVFDDTPILRDLPPATSYTKGVRVHGRSLAIAQFIEGWVVGHMTPADEFQAATPPFETVEESIGALIAIIANTKAMAILYSMDVQE